MDSMAEDSNKLHVAIFPWLAFGHILPFLELSKLLAQKGHRISFISTPRNIQRLPKIPQNLAPLINLVELPLPHQENLPRNAEATIDVPYDKIPYLKIAYDGLQESVEQFLKDSRPDWIVYDMLPHWLPPIAANLGISRVVFSIFSAWTICFLVNDNDTRTKPVHFTQPPQWVPFSTNVAFRLYEAKKIIDLLEKNNSGVPDVFRVAKTISGCDVFAIRSCMEIEEDWLDLLGELHRKPIIPIGLLPPSADGPRNDKDKTWLEIKEWLNKQEKDSVIYVALGSEVRPNRDDINELALGLEQSGLPFFWALRKQLGSSSDGDSYELPEGFEKRVKGRGLVWTSWAPQQSILAHNSVGGFVTHCGWSSVVEALYFGLPFIMLPFILDQGLNARALAEKKLGVEIPRDEKNGSFTRTSMAESLKLVAVNEEGKIYREKAKEMQKMFGDESLHNRYFDKFEEHLLKYKSRVKILASDS